MTEDARNGAGPGVRPALLPRTQAIFRRLGRDARDALGMIAELDKATAETVTVAGTDEITDEIASEVIELLRFAREQHPGQELDIVIFSAPEEAQRGDSSEQQSQGAGVLARR